MNECKNCNSEINGKYCSNCGQPAELKRIDANYIKHEIEHLLHLEKGIFFTIKELVLKPGKNINEFLTENRNRLVKPIIFIIVTSLIYSLINQYFQIENQYVNYEEGAKVSATGKIMKWIQEHYGYANILMGIIIAFFIKLLFKKHKYNFYEILILLCFIMGIGMIILSVFAFLQGIFKIELMAISGILFMIYITYAIADFYDKKRIINYVKAFSAYVFGMISFLLIAIFIGKIIDSF